MLRRNIIHIAKHFEVDNRLCSQPCLRCRIQHWTSE